MPNACTSSKGEAPKQSPAAPSYDARQYGLVTAVRDQGQCGSCWAHSTAAALEIAIAKRVQSNGQTTASSATTSAVPHLSLQALVDCVPATVPGSLQAVIAAKGCNGGWPATGAAWISGLGGNQPNGLPTEAAYPYAGTDGLCQKFTPYQYAASNTSSAQWKVDAKYLPNDADTIAAAVEQHGAVVATIQVLNDFLTYQEGVYDQPACTGAALSHAVTIVGFGTDAASGKKFWLIKNSFGRAWGEAGYVRMVRGKNMCGIEKNWPLILPLEGA